MGGNQVEVASRVRANQDKLAAELGKRFDFIVAERELPVRSSLEGLPPIQT
jgi:hypothetical protein